MKNKKRLIIISIIILLITIAAIVYIVLLKKDKNKLITEGKIGEDIIWSFDMDTKTLYIYGNGEIQNYKNETYVPWDNLDAYIKRVVVGNGITRICNDAFASCSFLYEVEIKSEDVVIGEGIFRGCDSLEKIILPDNCKNYCMIGDTLYSKDMKTLIVYCPANKRSTYRVRDGVTKIKKDAFYTNNSLKMIYFTESVESIEPKIYSKVCNREIVICNSKCKIFDEERGFGFKDEFIIYGTEGSTAHKYAEKYEMQFSSDFPEEPEYTEGNITYNKDYKYIRNVYISSNINKYSLIELEVDLMQGILEWQKRGEYKRWDIEDISEIIDYTEKLIENKKKEDENSEKEKNNGKSGSENVEIAPKTVWISIRTNDDNYTYLTYEEAPEFFEEYLELIAKSAGMELSELGIEKRY